MRLTTRMGYLYWAIISVLASIVSTGVYAGDDLLTSHRCVSLNTELVLTELVDDLLGSSLRTVLHDVLGLNIGTAVCLCSEEYMYDTFVDSHLSSVAALVGRDPVRRKLGHLVAKYGEHASQCTANLPRDAHECARDTREICTREASRLRLPRAEHKEDKSKKPTVHDAISATTTVATNIDKLYNAVPYRWRICDSDKTNPFETLLDEIVVAIRGVLSKSDNINRPEKHSSMVKQIDHIILEINHALNWPSVDEDLIKTLQSMRSKSHEALDSLHGLDDLLERCKCSHSPDLAYALYSKTGPLIHTAKEDDCNGKRKSSSKKKSPHKRSKGLESSGDDVLRELSPLKLLTRALEKDETKLRQASKSSEGIEKHAIYLVSRRTRLFLDSVSSLGSSHKLDLEPSWRLLQALDVETLSCIRTAGLSGNGGKRLDAVLHDVQKLMGIFGSITSMLDSCDCQTDSTLISKVHKQLSEKDSNDKDEKKHSDKDSNSKHNGKKETKHDGETHAEKKKKKAEKSKRGGDSLELSGLLASLNLDFSDDKSVQSILTGAAACRRISWVLDETSNRLHDACNCDTQDDADDLGIAIDGLLDHVSHVSEQIHEATQHAEVRMYEDLQKAIKVLLGNMFDVSERADLSCEMVGIVDDLIDGGKALLAIVGNLSSTLRQCGCARDSRVTAGLRRLSESESG